jgi:putative transposase
MSELYQSLSHSKWDCKYHIVFVPKRRRKVIFGQTRRHLGEIFHALARQKECQIIEGHLMPDHVHMCIAIPPKHPVASVIGFLKGKSAIAIARLCGKERNFSHWSPHRVQIFLVSRDLPGRESQTTQHRRDPLKLRFRLSLCCSEN